MAKLISIVMPAYNAGKYIRDAITSIFKQSYSEWELIIVDDKSSDNTREIVKNTAIDCARVQLICRSCNSGGCRIPRFEGIMVAKGDFVCCVDADDTIEPDYLSKLLLRQTETRADIVMGRMYLCNSSLAFDGRMIPAENYDMRQIFNGREACRRTIGSWQLAMAGMLVKRSIYTTYIEYISHESFCGSFADELDHRRLLLCAHKVAMVDAAYFYRQHATSIVHDVSADSFEKLHHFRELLMFVAKEFEGEPALIDRALRSHLTCVYRLSIEYYKNRFHYNGNERTRVMNILRNAYTCLDKYSGSRSYAVGCKEKLLSSSFQLLRTISFIVAKLT